LLRNSALPQLLGEREWDGSFERDELVNYLRAEKWPWRVSKERLSLM
jgi:hypothetical protein